MKSKALQFEWDEDKNKININKHGISFKMASRVFYDEHRLVFPDIQHSTNEERQITIGFVKDVLMVVHTMRGERVRIISARPATKAERERYYGKDCDFFL